MTPWGEVPLSKFVDLRRGFDLPTASRRPGPFAVISAGSKAGSHDEGPIPGPGFAIGRATNLGHPVWSDVAYWPLNTTLYVADFYGNLPKFAFYVFQSMDFTGFDSGSVQPMLNRNYIANIPIRVPNLTEQQRIVEVLDSLDSKIALNRKLQLAIQDLVSAIFTSMMKNSYSAPLSSTASFINGKPLTRGASGTGRVVVRIAELNSGISSSTVYSDARVAHDHTVQSGDILFGWSGSLTLHRWYRAEAIVNQHIFKVVPKPGLQNWLVFELIKQKLPRFRDIAADKATTMGHIQRRHLDEPVSIPNSENVARWDPVMSSLWNRALLAEQESEQLLELRRVLLPQLISGKLHIRNANAQVQDLPQKIWTDIEYSEDR